jgi:hypothetical protein
MGYRQHSLRTLGISTVSAELRSHCNSDSALAAKRRSSCFVVAVCLLIRAGSGDDTYSIADSPSLSNVSQQDCATFFCVAATSESSRSSL